MIYQSDIFTATLSRKEQLYLFIKARVYCKTSEVLRWGVDNFSNRADRDARALAEEIPPRIRRLEDHEKIFRGFGKLKEDVWTII
jgi:hypothetical protein